MYLKILYLCNNKIDNMINRKLRQIIEQRLFRRKIIVLTGPRQVGKTTLLNIISSRIKQDRGNVEVDGDIFFFS